MKEEKTKRLSKPILALLILVGITVLLCLTVLGLWLRGRSQLTKTVAVPVIEESEREGYTILHDGKYYRYNENMCNILLLGIDAGGKPVDGTGDAQQADVLLLAALDLSANRMTLISIPRDTMCDMEIRDESGRSQGIAHAQLALSYAYGATLRQCCEMCRDTVSNLMGGLPIQSYAAFYMDGISVLNDAVGGVTVTVLDDYPFTHMPDCRNLIAGQEVTLNGVQANKYIRCRLEEQVDSNALRMQRQKQYMLALISQAKQLVKEQPGKALSLYSAVQDYTVTDLDISRISYLTTAATRMSFSGDIVTLQGELSLGEGNHAELVPDQEALYDLMLSVFYTEVPAPDAE